MLNSCIFMGRLVADPELRKVKVGDNEVSVTSFTIAVQRPYSKNTKERVSDFIRCSAWRGMAETICNYFSKGNRIIVEGAMHVQSDKNEDGSYRTRSELLVESFEFVESRVSSDSNSSETPSFDNAPDEDDDGLPF
jgi:single-strand DNA-binding protein